MIYALDTNIFSHLVQGHERVTARFAEAIATTEHEVTIPVIVRVEVLRGRFNAITTAADGAALVRLADLMIRTESALDPFRILPVTRAVADCFDSLLKHKKLKKVGSSDLLIASIAIAYDATLVTRNTKDFAAMPGIRLENWTD